MNKNINLKKSLMIGFSFYIKILNDNIIEFIFLLF
jgi:hypothetical protein